MTIATMLVNHPDSHALPDMKELIVLLIVVCVPFPVKSSSARGACDPLVPQYCYLPLPNSFFTVKDTTTATGIAVSFDDNSLPPDTFSRGFAPNEWNTFDGFPPFPSIITYFENVDSSNLPPHWDIAQSLFANSPTILYNLQTGARVPHFSELDVSFSLDVDKRALMIWPAVQLNASTNYLVVIRHLKHSNGTTVAPSKAFSALRDSIITNDKAIEYRRSKYNQYFNTLVTAGIIDSKTELQLIWDFSTASEDYITKRLLHMRTDSMRRVGPSGPSYVLSEITDNFSDNIYRRIVGVMNVPIYLNTPLPGGYLVIDERGSPIFQKNASATFTILIPHSLANGSITTPTIVQYGHGLFGSQAEVETGYLQEQANRYGYILASCDLWGMSGLDLPAIVSVVIKNISDFRIVPDRLSQGVINELLLMKSLKGSLYKDISVTLNDKILIDPNHAYYYGVSLGGVVGQVYMALTQDVNKGVLGVPGGPFGLLLPRSSDFKQYEEIIRVLYPDPVDFITIIFMFNMLWSRCGPGGFMNSITNSLLPDTPTHRVIYQYGLGDAQVNVLGAYSSARSNNAKMFQSNVKESFILGDKIITDTLFGLQLVPDNSVITEGSVAVGYDCHAPPEPAGDTPPNDSTDTHELPRRTRSAQEQMYLFFKTGEIHNMCKGGGACVNDCQV